MSVMLTPFDSNQRGDLLKETLYNDPILYVEELATLEGSPAGQIFHGWYNHSNPQEYLLIRENWEGTRSIYFQPQQAEYSDIPWQELLDGRVYIQTNNLGEQFLQTLPYKIIVPHSILYFRWETEKNLDSEPMHSLDKFKLKTEVKFDDNHRLIDLYVNLVANNKTIVSAGSNLINKKTAMVGIGVNPEWRDKGLATIILKKACQELLNRGITPVYACDQHNIPSYKLAKHFFVQSGEYRALFVGNWTLNRPKASSNSLPDSLFVS